MRNAFIDELVLQASTDDRIVLMVGDLGYSVVEPFAKKFPNRFINAGVAEQNMMGVAAGMASEGYHVFVYSIANFPTFRCAEQIRNDIDYHNLPVTVVAVGGGLGYGNLGYSHHAIQDYALMRLFPNVLIASPGDPNEVRSCVKYLTQNSQPSYLRLGKAGELNMRKERSEVELGIWKPLVINPNDTGKVLLTTGSTLQMAESYLSLKEYNDYSIYSLPLWGMSAKISQPEQIKKWKKIITLEDHLMDGGFCSWLREASGNDIELIKKIEGIALNSKVCGLVGSQDTLNKIGGL
jgi:transketolase